MKTLSLAGQVPHIKMGCCKKWLFMPAQKKLKKAVPHLSFPLVFPCGNWHSLLYFAETFLMWVVLPAHKINACSIHQSFPLLILMVVVPIGTWPGKMLQSGHFKQFNDLSVSGYPQSPSPPLSYRNDNYLFFLIFRLPSKNILQRNKKFLTRLFSPVELKLLRCNKHRQKQQNTEPAAQTD